MGSALQEFGWKKSGYERPSDGWVCGRLCEGAPCQLGPTGSGVCQIQSQCTPEKDGDRFVCKRPKPLGGPCPEGPLPDGSCCQLDAKCQPRRSLMVKRRNVSIAFAAMCAAFCFYVFGAKEPTLPMSPGHVSFQHSAIETNCRSCHVAADQHESSLTVANFTEATSTGDSHRCLNCHKDVGPDALNPHSMSDTELAALTNAATKSNSETDAPFLLLMAANLSSNDHQSNLACSACHQEHRGHEHDLKHMTNLQCQGCHQSQFYSFSDGHPELESFPYSRRTRIYFDHATHLKQYFVDDEFRRLMPDGVAPESCDTCHQPDPAGNMLLTTGFDTMCATCHSQEIKDRDYAGIEFLALPVLSPDAIALTNVGEWPAPPIESGPHELPPFMRMLLESNPLFQRASETLGDLVPGKLEEAAGTYPGATSKYLWSIKRLIFELTEHGEAGLLKRLDGNSYAVRELMPSIIPSVVSVRRMWFPNLAAEIQARTDDASLPPTDDSVLTSAVAVKPIGLETSLGGGWYVRDADHTVRYRASGHADPLIRDWLNSTIGAIGDEYASDATRDLLDVISSPTASGRLGSAPVASGRCLLCHTVESDSGKPKINWHSRQPDQNNAPLTRFSHSPHRSLPEQATCITCHALEELSVHTDSFRAAFAKRDKSTGSWQPVTSPDSIRTSGFLPVSKETCAVCHVPESAGNSCLNCHTYHRLP